MKLFPCTYGGCKNEVPLDGLEWCEKCGSPQCKEHQECGMCKDMESFRFSCQECEWESGAGWQDEIPDTLEWDEHGYGLLLCTECAPVVNRRIAEYESQLKLEFEPEGDLPF